MQPGDRGEFAAIAAVSLAALDRGTIRVVEPQPKEGREAALVELMWGDQDSNSCTFAIDEERGFVPIEAATSFNGKPFTRAYVTDIRACSGGRWFPTRCVAIWLNGPEEGGSHTVREVLVTSLDADTRPDRGAFSLDLPAGMRVNDGEKPAAVFTTSADEKITLGGLAELFERTQQSAGARQARQGKSGATVAFVVAGFGLLALVLVAWAVWRRGRA
jgi:hypothetical protein